MRQLYLNRAIAEAVAQEMERDERVVLIGEDIINRGGGNLVIELFHADPAENRLRDGSFPVSVNGFRRTLDSGDKVILQPGDSICLEPIHAHRFYNYQRGFGHYFLRPGQNEINGQQHNQARHHGDNPFLSQMQFFFCKKQLHVMFVINNL